MSRDRNSRYRGHRSNGNGAQKNDAQKNQKGRDFATGKNERMDARDRSGVQGNRQNGHGNGHQKGGQNIHGNGHQHQPGQNRGGFKPTYEQLHENDEAIRIFKSENQSECSICGQMITDLASALAGKDGLAPVHFECALKSVSDGEKLEDGDKIAYIGQGRFAVLNYPNIRDIKHWSIKKIIPWEDKDTQIRWRGQMAELYSRTK